VVQTFDVSLKPLFEAIFEKKIEFEVDFQLDDFISYLLRT
jgi:hypothetical protein